MTMSKVQIGQIIGIVLAAVVALLGVLGYDVIVIQPREAAQNPPAARSLTTNFTDIAVRNATASGTLGVTGAATFAGLNKLTAGSTITVTNGAPFALTATLQPIQAAGAVTPTITIPAADVTACIYNTSSNAILIQDTGNQVLTADATLGQYDVLCGYSDGTRFIETSRANN